MRTLMLILVFLFSTASHSMGIDDLFFAAVQTGSSSGVVDTGEWPEKFKKTTHSSDFPVVKFEKLGVSKDDCYIMKMTATQSNIPDRSGKIIGDYMIVTKLVACQRAAVPSFDKPVAVLDCQIGGQSCMPKR